MTKWLWLFFVFYFLVGQPAILWWMQNDNNFYWLAWLNAWVFFVAWIVSAMFKSSHEEVDSENITSQLIWEKLENGSKSEESLVNTQETTAKESNVEKFDVKNVIPQLQSSIYEENTQKTQSVDKSETVEEKPMKEGVNIPKIVQPLWTTWRSTAKKKKKRELCYGQWIVMLVSLVIVCFISYTLWEFLDKWGIAIALFLWRVLYLIIWKLFDVNGFYAVRKLFTNWLYILLILWGIWYWIYFTQQEWLSSFLPQKWVDRISSYVGDFWKLDSDDGTWSMYVFELTGEVIVDSGMDTLIDSWNLESEIDNAVTWVVENLGLEVNTQSGVDQPEVNVQPEVEVDTGVSTVSQNSEPSVDSPEREVTMWEAVKHLLQWYTLSTKNDKSFTYVAKSNELYPYFKTAQEKAMIWFDTNPNKRISCETYMALKWILEWWSVNIYDRSQTRVIYWNKANELGKTNWCARWAFVKVKNL